MARPSQGSEARPTRPASPTSPDRAVSAVKAVAPLAGPIAAAALALFLFGRLLEGLLSGQLGFFPGVPGSQSGAALATPVTGAARSVTAPAAGVSGAALTGAPSAASPGAPSTANAASAALVIDALAVGRYVQVRGASGAWPRRGMVERSRRDAPPRLSAASPALSETSALEAVDSARSLLGREYRAQEVLASRLVLARFLAPEEAGTSVEGGVPSQLGDVVLAERPAWLILFKVEEPGRTLVE